MIKLLRYKYDDYVRRGFVWFCSLSHTCICTTLLTPIGLLFEVTGFLFVNWGRLSAYFKMFCINLMFMRYSIYPLKLKRGFKWSQYSAAGNIFWNSNASSWELEGFSHKETTSLKWQTYSIYSVSFFNENFVKCDEYVYNDQCWSVRSFRIS